MRVRVCIWVVRCAASPTALIVLALHPGHPKHQSHTSRLLLALLLLCSEALQHLRRAVAPRPCCPPASRGAHGALPCRPPPTTGMHSYVEPPVTGAWCVAVCTLGQPPPRRATSGPRLRHCAHGLAAVQHVTY